MKKTIEIVVTPSGETTVQTNGFTGPSCRNASKFLEDALGQQSREQITPDFYQTTQAEIPNQQQN
jgi:hypothetical protein